MEMTRWETNLNKGRIGEAIVDDYLIGKGVVPYQPSDLYDGAHPFDRLCATRDKKRIFIAEIKTKPARLYYPDTGFNERNFRDYQHIQETYGIRIFIFFVDEQMCSVYGDYLDSMEQLRTVEYNGRTLIYPLSQKGIRYYLVSEMRKIVDLTLEQVDELKSLTTRSYDYD